jgi:hypothetical protein
MALPLLAQRLTARRDQVVHEPSLTRILREIALADLSCGNVCITPARSGGVMHDVVMTFTNELGPSDNDFAVRLGNDVPIFAFHKGRHRYVEAHALPHGASLTSDVALADASRPLARPGWRVSVCRRVGSPGF